MKKICIPMVIVLSFIAIELKAQTVVVTRPVRRIVVAPPVKFAIVKSAPVVVVRPARVVVAPRTVVVRPAPVVVYAPPQRAVIVKKTVIYH